MGDNHIQPKEKAMFSRRDVLATAAAGAAMSTTAAAAASFGNPDNPPQGAINAKNPASVTDPGPQNPAIRDQLPSAFSPPATDVGGMPQIWASFNTAPRRIQNGGWARQVTQADFPISTTISGVNMRLSPGGVRELHWHQAGEWAYMTYGNCRVTVLDPKGRPYVADVKEGDIWYFPSGYPHSLQGLEPDGCEFVICFDDGAANEFNTLLVTDWFAHTPPSVLAKNFGEPAETFANIPLHNLWIYQGKVPGDLSSVRKAMTGADRDSPPEPFTFSLCIAVACASVTSATQKMRAPHRF
jgi:oxalate decarboxylase